MPFKTHVFISSRIKELHDIRDGIKHHLGQFGLEPILSNDNGFPDFADLSPHASCLRIIEECPLVIGILDKSLGEQISDWRPYSDYSQHSPTVAELKHTMLTQKRLMLFVRRTTWDTYQTWLTSGKNSNSVSHEILQVFEFLDNLQAMLKPPWIRQFDSITDLNKALTENLINELYKYYREKEQEATDQTQYLLDKITEAAPDVRIEIENKLNPNLVGQIDQLKRNLEELRSELTRKESLLLEEYEQKESELLKRINDAEAKLTAAKINLGLAAMKDVAWLQHLRTTLMPKQLGRVPFHNDAEVAIRGFHNSNMRGAPNLKSVSWSKLEYQENKLHRGYYAGLIFKGANFPPGVTFATRPVGEASPPSGKLDYWWRLPNVYFGDYLEVSTNDDEDESPLSWRQTEFSLRAPGGECSDWVKFSYDFDFVRLKTIYVNSKNLGEKLFDQASYQKSLEALRKAYVFAKHLDDIPEVEIAKLNQLRGDAAKKAIEMLPYKAGTIIEVLHGENKGLKGTIINLYIGGYVIEVDNKRYTISSEDVE